MKYLVMQCHMSYATVLDEDGRFLKVANLRYTPGQTVEEVFPMARPEEKPSRPWAASLALAAACLVLVLTGLLNLSGGTVGSVYLTINPAVRLDVDRRDRVVDLEGANADGDLLIEGYDYEKKDMELVVEELVERAVDLGYLHQGGRITLTLDGEDQSWVVSHTESLTTRLDETLGQKMSVAITVTDSHSAEGKAVIPVTPAQTEAYGESDYGESDQTAGTAGDSDYGAQDNSDSGYEGATDYAPDDDSGYEPTQADSVYEPAQDDSGYEPTQADSGYEPTQADSGYEPAQDDSGYEPTQADSGGAPAQDDSGYEPPDDDSGYEPPQDDGDSDYED